MADDEINIELGIELESTKSLEDLVDVISRAMNQLNGVSGDLVKQIGQNVRKSGEAFTEFNDDTKNSVKALREQLKVVTDLANAFKGLSNSQAKLNELTATRNAKISPQDDFKAKELQAYSSLGKQLNNLANRMEKILGKEAAAPYKVKAEEYQRKAGDKTDTEKLIEKQSRSELSRFKSRFGSSKDLAERKALQSEIEKQGLLNAELLVWISDKNSSLKKALDTAKRSEVQKVNRAKAAIPELLGNAGLADRLKVAGGANPEVVSVQREAKNLKSAFSSRKADLINSSKKITSDKEGADFIQSLSGKPLFKVYPELRGALLANIEKSISDFNNATVKNLIKEASKKISRNENLQSVYDSLSGVPKEVADRVLGSITQLQQDKQKLTTYKVKAEETLEALKKAVAAGKSLEEIKSLATLYDQSNVFGKASSGSVIRSETKKRESTLLNSEIQSLKGKLAVSTASGDTAGTEKIREELAQVSARKKGLPETESVNSEKMFIQADKIKKENSDKKKLFKARLGKATSTSEVNALLIDARNLGLLDIDLGILGESKIASLTKSLESGTLERLLKLKYAKVQTPEKQEELSKIQASAPDSVKAKFDSIVKDKEEKAQYASQTKNRIQELDKKLRQAVSDSLGEDALNKLAKEYDSLSEGRGKTSSQVIQSQQDKLKASLNKALKEEQVLLESFLKYKNSPQKVLDKFKAYENQIKSRPDARPDPRIAALKNQAEEDLKVLIEAEAAFKEAKKHLESLSKTSNTTQAELNEAVNRYDSANRNPLSNSSFHRFSGDQTRRVSANTNEDRQTDILESAMRRIRDPKFMALQGIMTINSQIIYGIMNALQGSVTEILAFEDALANLETYSGASKASLRELKEEFLSLGSASKFSLSELTSAATTLIQQGKSVADVKVMLSGIQTFALATGSGIENATDLISNLANVYQISADQTSKLAEEATATLNMSRLNAESYAEFLKYASNAAKEFGIDRTLLQAVGAGLSNQGITQGSTAGTGLRRLLSDLADPTDKAKKVFEGLGISLDDVNVRSKGLVGVLRELKKLSPEDMFKVFEVQSAQVLLPLTRIVDELGGFSEAITNSTGAVEKAKIQSSTLTASFRSLGNAIVGSGEQSTEGFRKSLAKLVQVITSVVSGIGNISFGLDSLAGTVIGSGVLGVGITLLIRGVTSLGPALLRLALGAQSAAAGFRALSLASLGFGGWAGLITTIGTIAFVTANALFPVEDLTESLEKQKDALEKAKQSYQSYGEKIDQVKSRLQDLKDKSEYFETEKGKPDKEIFVRNLMRDFGGELDKYNIVVSSDQSVKDLQKALETLPSRLSGEKYLSLQQQKDAQVETNKLNERKNSELVKDKFFSRSFFGNLGAYTDPNEMFSVSDKRLNEAKNEVVSYPLPEKDKEILSRLFENYYAPSTSNAYFPEQRDAQKPLDFKAYLEANDKNLQGAILSLKETTGALPVFLQVTLDTLKEARFAETKSAGEFALKAISKEQENTTIKEAVEKVLGSIQDKTTKVYKNIEKDFEKESIGARTSEEYVSAKNEVLKRYEKDLEEINSITVSSITKQVTDEVAKRGFSGEAVNSKIKSEIEGSDFASKQQALSTLKRDETALPRNLERGEELSKRITKVQGEIQTGLSDLGRAATSSETEEANAKIKQGLKELKSLFDLLKSLNPEKADSITASVRDTLESTDGQVASIQNENQIKQLETAAKNSQTELRSKLETILSSIKDKYDQLKDENLPEEKVKSLTAEIELLSATAKRTATSLDELSGVTKKSTVSLEGLTPVQKKIYQGAVEQGLDPLSVLSYVQSESSFQSIKNPTSSASGLFQLLDSSKAKAKEATGSDDEIVQGLWYTKQVGKEVKGLSLPEGFNSQANLTKMAMFLGGPTLRKAQGKDANSKISEFMSAKQISDNGFSPDTTFGQMLQKILVSGGNSIKKAQEKFSKILGTTSETTNLAQTEQTLAKQARSFSESQNKALEEHQKELMKKKAQGLTEKLQTLKGEKTDSESALSQAFSKESFDQISKAYLDKTREIGENTVELLKAEGKPDEAIVEQLKQNARELANASAKVASETLNRSFGIQELELRKASLESASSKDGMSDAARSILGEKSKATSLELEKASYLRDQSRLSELEAAGKSGTTEYETLSKNIAAYEETQKLISEFGQSELQNPWKGLENGLDAYTLKVKKATEQSQYFSKVTETGLQAIEDAQTAAWNSLFLQEKGFSQKLKEVFRNAFTDIANQSSKQLSSMTMSWLTGGSKTSDIFGSTGSGLLPKSGDTKGGSMFGKALSAGGDVISSAVDWAGGLFGYKDSASEIGKALGFSSGEGDKTTSAFDTIGSALGLSSGEDQKQPDVGSMIVNAQHVTVNGSGGGGGGGKGSIPSFGKSGIPFANGVGELELMPSSQSSITGGLGTTTDIMSFGKEFQTGDAGLSEAAGDLTSAATGLTEAGSGFDSVFSGFGSIFSGFGGLLSSILPGLSGGGAGAAASGIGALGSIFGGGSSGGGGGDLFSGIMGGAGATAAGDAGGVGSAFGMLATIPGFASGGLIQGDIQNKDSVLLKGMPGEGILTKPAVKALGVPALSSLNAGKGLNINPPSMENKTYIVDDRSKIPTQDRNSAHIVDMMKDADRNGPMIQSIRKGLSK